MIETPQEQRDFLIYYAKVLLREATARRGQAFSHTLLDWAGKARRDALAINVQPVQRDLFG